MNIRYLIALCTLNMLSLLYSDGHGYIEKIKNDHATATLYALSTDPTPGQFYTTNKDGSEAEHDGGTILKVAPSQSITHFNNYVIPFQSFGGKIYLWLKDKNGTILNAATIQEIDSYVTFQEDHELHTPDYLYAQDAMIPNVFITQCARKTASDPLICKWWRNNTNQQFTLQIGTSGSFVLYRYSETPATTKCALGDVQCAFNAVGTFFKNSTDTIGDAFKNLGGDVTKGFSKLQSCMDVAALGTELAAKVAAKETILSGKLSDAIIQAAQEAAIQPLIATRKAAQQVLDDAQAFLDKVANPITAGTLSAAQQTSSGVLKAGETVATGVLTAADETVQGILNLFDVRQITYKGSLQELAHGTLGDIACKATIAHQNVDFSFSLNIKDPQAVLDSIKSLSQKIADRIMDAAKQAAKALKITYADIPSVHEDCIKLTMQRYVQQAMVYKGIA